MAGGLISRHPGGALGSAHAGAGTVRRDAPPRASAGLPGGSRRRPGTRPISVALSAEGLGAQGGRHRVYGLLYSSITKERLPATARVPGSTGALGSALTMLSTLISTWCTPLPTVFR